MKHLERCGGHNGASGGTFAGGDCFLLVSWQKPGMDVADGYVTFVRHSQDMLREKINEEVYTERLFEVSCFLRGAPARTPPVEAVLVLFWSGGILLPQVVHQQTRGRLRPSAKAFSQIRKRKPTP